MPSVKMNQGNNVLGTQPIPGMIWKFAIPAIISAMTNQVYNLIAQVYIGWSVGDLGIAATNVAFPLAILITALSALFGMGGAAKFGLYMGQGKPEEASQTIGNALVLMVVSGLAVSIAATVFLRPLLYAFGATEAIMTYAIPYTLITNIGIPFGILAVGASYLIRADGSPSFSMLVVLSGVIFNLIAAPVFLFGLEMGIGGVALATTLGQMLSSAVAIYYLRVKFKSVSLKREGFQLRGAVIKGVCALGSAAFFTHLAAAAVQIVQSNALRYYGAQSIYGSEATLAAAGAVIKVMAFLMSVVIGISLGCQPIFSYNYGSKRYDRVKEAYKLAVSYATMVSVIAFLCIQIFPRPILSIFGSGNPLFYDFAVQYMHIYLLMTFANGIQPVTSTFFSSIGKARIGFWMSLVRQVILLMPLLLILPIFWGINGVLWAGPLADGIAVVLVILFAAREMRIMTGLQLKQVPDAGIARNS